ncbi:minichromosome maintenance protein [Theileria orientalis strain Shintoku]|uniref:Minichromosome maintenance protein n=1 Tax=Theileria orientalis strain Shintoku TaxID=869250 RepID=J4D5T1_THEOR|nr:minichromosome maintenance protein [Theileria orientalis strain Shintoku]BAM39160.1 minichromosome maintenance protein [Theileria orientalis strain Shintoku]|eukprot:XP_009689461.1 minichromosome maintenance protein [Theileria orientalis strain Shintoku]
MSSSTDVISVISQLYISDLEIDASEFKKRLDQWVNFFMTHWNLLIEPVSLDRNNEFVVTNQVKEEFFETHVLRLNYEQLLELDVPPSVEAFKKDFYSTPELTLSAMSASLHIYTCYYLRSNKDDTEKKKEESSCMYLNKINNVGLNMKIKDYLIINNVNNENAVNDKANAIYDAMKKEVADNELNNLLNGEGLDKYIHFNEIKNQNVIVRVYNYKPVTKFVNLRSHTVGCVASIMGQIIRISKPKTLVTSALFTCCKCDKSFFKRFKMGLFDPPTKCIQKSCDSRFFIINRHYVITTIYQTLRLQEYMLRNNCMDTSKTNSVLDIQVADDLVGRYNLGNVLNVIGIIKMNTTSNVNLYKDNKLIYKMYLSTVSVNVISNKNCIIVNNNSGSGASEKEDYNTFIKDIYYNEPNRFYLVATSLFPSLKGKYYQKVGLLLSLLGGVNIYDEYKNIKKRGTIHVLLIGEPGVGKSHMLSCISTSLGNHMVSASNITNSGLTAGLVKDNNEFNLEAGILVLLNNSTLCIDELDKLNSTDILLEVMEAQRVSIAKGGIVKTLKAQTTLICAANPIHSKFNKNLVDNIKLSKTLLSRFDLVFLLINDKSDYDDYYDVNKNEETDLIRKLKSFTKYDFLNNILINEYIEYGRRYINPTFTKEAKEELNLFFKELIELNKDNTNILKLTTRQLQGLIRLCQSRARGDLMKVVTKEHVKDVVEVFKNTVYYPTFMNIFESSSVQSINDKKGKKDLIKIFINELKTLLNNKTGEMCQLARDVISKNKSTMEAEELVYRVNNLGYILKQGTNWKTNL